jgi:ubiquinone biosynthesis protein COQ4
MVNVTSEARYFTPELAQMLSQANVCITSTGYNRTALHYHHVLPTYLDAMQRGISVGSALREPLFLYQWEGYLDWQLDDIAKHLGFIRGPGTEWDWTTEATNG